MDLLEARTEFVNRYGLLHLVGDSADDAEDVDVDRAMLDWIISRLAGVSDTLNNSGLFAYGDIGLDSLKVSATSPASLAVSIHAGACFIDNAVVRLEADTILPTGTVEGLPRVDLVAIDTSGTVHILPGTPAATPEAPATSVGYYGLATLTHRVGETSIQDIDDGVNGYITIIGEFCNA